MTIRVNIGDTAEYREALAASLTERGIPGYMHEAVIDYIMTGRPVGNFLTALFSNDLMEAFGRADDNNQRCMLAYVKFLYNDVPMGCRGSPEAVLAWLSVGGLRGVLRERETT